VHAYVIVSYERQQVQKKKNVQISRSKEDDAIAVPSWLNLAEYTAPCRTAKADPDAPRGRVGFQFQTTFPDHSANLGHVAG
jgi:hypothetical protein